MSRAAARPAEVGRGDTERFEHFLGVMERNVLRLVQQMEQLEALSRLQTKQPDAPDVQQVDVSTVAWEVSRQLRARWLTARDVKVYIGEASPVIVIDTARLELILMNLVSNAIKLQRSREAAALRARRHCPRNG